MVEFGLPGLASCGEELQVDCETGKGLEPLGGAEFCVAHSDGQVLGSWVGPGEALVCKLGREVQLGVLLC